MLFKKKLFLAPLCSCLMLLNHASSYMSLTLKQAERLSATFPRNDNKRIRLDLKIRFPLLASVLLFAWWRLHISLLREFGPKPSCPEEPAENDTCMEQVLSPGIPGEGAGKLEYPPLLLPPTSTTFAFLIMYQFLLSSLAAPGPLRLPVTVIDPSRSLFFAKQVLFKIMFDTLTARTKTV